MKKNYFVFCQTIDGERANININRVESYIEHITDDHKNDSVEVTFYSGKTLLLKEELDQELYYGDSLSTLLDLYIADFSLGQHDEVEAV